MTTSVEEREQIIGQVHTFVEREIIPVASELEHANQYPHAIVRQMKEMGLFGLTVPEEYGGSGVDFATYARVIEEITRGWMSISGILNTHLLVAYMIRSFGTEDQKRRFLPPMARGEHHSALALSEPNAGTDVQAITTRAVPDGDDYVVNGTKMWATNGALSTMAALAAKTDPAARPAYKGISLFLAVKGPGFRVGRNIDKLGYKGVETTELIFEDYRVPRANLLGGQEGQGFFHVMSGLEVGRINVAARGVGIARAAFEAAIQYAQIRTTMGKPIAEHQAIQLKLADMATRLEAARLLTAQAAAKKDAGERCDLEAGMAKLFATESAMENALDAMRIHGGIGYSQELPVERYFRDAPLMLIGEGTNEIQRLVIARNLLKRYPAS